MEFILEGNQVNCVRVGADPTSGRTTREVVVSFDAHLHEIAPHVLAALAPSEIAALRRWLRDRAKLHDNEATLAMLQGLPEMLAQAESLLRSEGQIGSDLATSLRDAISTFGAALDAAEVVDEAVIPDLEQMNDVDALRVHMDVARRKL